MSGRFFISKYDLHIYAILRIVISFLFILHGWEKIYTLPQAGISMPFYIVLIAGPIEFFGGILVMVGLFTRWAAFICSGEMAFAFWIAHSTNLVLPFLNGTELAAIYCFVFLYISTRGSVIFGIDNWLEKRKLAVNNQTELK